MANFISSKKESSDFNNGVQYVNGDIVQAETINNLVESALYSQEKAELSQTIADSALTVSEKALSKIEQIIDDKTLLPKVEKNMYNLGAYDIVVSNGDGTATVTRKTGYKKFDGSEEWFTDGYKYGYRMSLTDGTPTNHAFASIKTIQDGSVAYNYEGSNEVIFAPSTGKCSFYFYLDSVGNSKENAKAWLAEHPVYVQYELPVEQQYTENVIENQPIHTFNQEQEEKLRELLTQNTTELFITVTDENPAIIKGGDWLDKGTTTTSDGTTLHIYERI